MKDIERIQSIEKAIAEKYGDDASRDIRHGWDKEKEQLYAEQYNELCKRKNRSLFREEINKEGYLLIKKKRKSGRTTSCPVCASLFDLIRDDIIFQKFDCCSTCFIKFVEHREERWLGGWRPKSKEED
jgi:hypothetical protein